MKLLMLAVPATLFMTAAGLAQTDTTTTGTSVETSGSGEFGTNWPLTVGTTFLIDDSSAKVRPIEELSQGWQSLTPEDQTMIRTDCQAFLAAHGNATGSDSSAATTGTAGTEGSTDSMGTADSTTGSASTDTTTTGTADTSSTETGASDTATDTTATGDAATTAPVGYDMAEMKAICDAVGAL
jgi:hypothetical protein